MGVNRELAGIALLLAVYLMSSVIGFNLSPRPNLVLREPQMDDPVGQPKTRSSYFGFTINMRRNSIIIGAPRAQSSLPQQANLNETGAIYRCPVQNIDFAPTTASCEPFVFESAGNLPDGVASSKTFDGEMRENQWLGASMDGGDEDTDQLVVCAPRMFTNSAYGKLDVQLNHGICYWTADTTKREPVQVAKINPLTVKTNRLSTVNGNEVYFYMLAEEGISVHVTENGKEVLIGAPGISNWMGSVIRFREEEIKDSGGMSRRSTPIATTVNYDSQVPNPSLWSQPEFSYFGYAVSSGYFESSEKLLYVASAPQANEQQGEVYIFDMVDALANTQSIRIYHTLLAGQMGEYFGYSLVVDDFNGDNWPDLAVGAPLHSKDGSSFENGVVYVFLNDRGTSFRSTVLQSEYPLNGRFGTALSKVGDVDGDGFNDLVIGAPFEDDGAVYLFLGSKVGLGPLPSQRLVPSTTPTIPAASSMFGHGLSRGSDIDGNHFLDLAVGAPNADAVFVFRAYPVGQIEASITPNKNSLSTSDTSLELTACWRLVTKHPFEHAPNIGIDIRLDPHHSRMTYIGKKSIIINSTVSSNDECRKFEVSVAYIPQFIFRSVTFDMYFDVLDRIPDSEEFCSTCIAINPINPKIVQSKVIFTTGCISDRCMADLRISSTVSTPLPFLLGSAQSISIDYDIRNTGETAFLPQLIVRTSPEVLTFMKIPLSCNRPAGGNSSELLCDLNNGSPLNSGDETTFRIHLDTRRLVGSEFRVQAVAMSTGDEKNMADNEVEDIVPLAEFSTIEVAGKSSVSLVSLEDEQQLFDVTHAFEIRNIGPSNIEELDVIISIPSTFLDTWSVKFIEIIAFNDLSMRAVYETRFHEVKWKQNDTVLVHDPLELSQPSQDQISFDNAEPIQELLQEQSSRRRRAIREAQLTLQSRRSYNRYTRSVQEIQLLQTTQIDGNRLEEDLNPFISSLPMNRTIFIDCSTMIEGCIRGRFTVSNFKVTGNLPILVSVNFKLNLEETRKILNDEKDFIVLRSMATISKKGDQSGKTIAVVSTSPYTVISKYVLSSTPIWVYIVSAVGGVIVLLLIIYTMYKFGFFRRQKKEELEQFKRKSQALALQGEQELED